MKKLLIILFICFSEDVFCQNVVGAWEWIETNDEGRRVKRVAIFSEKFQVATWFDAETGAFVSTNGGFWSLNGNTMTEIVEFDSDRPERVNDTVSFEIEWKGEDEMGIVGSGRFAKRIDAGRSGDLLGAWLISGRMQDGNIQERETDRPRKTMKILSGMRFQWIAYNTESKQFLGTGGGSYTSVDGKYTENIEFFSRDNNRVGSSLEFSYEIKEGKWHHSGKNSKGEPMYEVWSVREK